MTKTGKSFPEVQISTSEHKLPGSGIGHITMRPNYIHLDFNSVDEDGYVGLVKNCDRKPFVGEVMVMHDTPYWTVGEVIRFEPDYKGEPDVLVVLRMITEFWDMEDQSKASPS